MKILNIEQVQELVTLTTDKGTAAVQLPKKEQLKSLNNIELTTWQELAELPIKDKKNKEAVIEALLSITNYTFSAFQQIKKIPRPLTIIAENQTHQIGLLSLDAKSITKAMWANEQIYKKIKNQLFSFTKEVIPSTQTTEEILTTINEIARQQEKEWACKIQPTLICKKNMQSKEIETLIHNFNVCYLENAQDNEIDLKKITETNQQRCFIAATYEPKERVVNAVAVHKIHLGEILQIQKEKKFIPFVYTTTAKEVHLATGCEVPVIIFPINNTQVPKTISLIEEQIHKLSMQNR